MLQLINFVSQLFSRKDGQGLAEYALILVLVSIAVIVVLTLLGTSISDVFQSVVDALTPAAG